MLPHDSRPFPEAAQRTTPRLKHHPRHRPARGKLVVGPKQECARRNNCEPARQAPKRGKKSGNKSEIAAGICQARAPGWLPCGSVEIVAYITIYGEIQRILHGAFVAADVSRPKLTPLGIPLPLGFFLP